MTRLAPLLHQPKSAWTTDMNDSVLRLFGVAEAALTSGQYIGGTTLTSADISIWVLLSHLVSQAWLLQQLPAVRAWFEGISELPQVKVCSSDVRHAHSIPNIYACYCVLAAISGRVRRHRSQFGTIKQIRRIPETRYSEAVSGGHVGGFITDLHSGPDGGSRVGARDCRCANRIQIHRIR